MFTKMWRSVVAVTLVASLVLGMTGTAFAADDSINWTEVDELSELQSALSTDKSYIRLTGDIDAGDSTLTIEKGKTIVTVISKDDALNYVSLGDSMTNGYGMPGYDGNTGVEDYGNGSYANLFATEYGLNHAQLAMSAMRAEDLHWLLELDYENADAIALTDAHPNDDGYYSKHKDGENCGHTNAVYHGDDYSKKWWDEVHEAKWNAMFTTGDYWTWNELCDDYRLGVAAYAIKNDGAIGKITDGEASIVAEYYQSAVANTDILSLGIGNGNFGVFMFGRILEAIGFSGDPVDIMIYDVENAIRECDPIMQDEIRKLINILDTTIDQYLGSMVGGSQTEGEDVTALEALKNIILYTSISFVLNYAGTVEAILQLNDDAEIILVALMNTFEDAEEPALLDSLEGDAEGIPAGFSIGDLMGAVFGPLNTFIAALPTYMQATNNNVYEDATFYYAEGEKVECLVDVYGEDFKNEDGTPNENSIIRDRFVDSIVGYCDHDVQCVDVTTCSDWDTGMVWGLLGGVELVAGITLTAVTLDEIATYDGMPDDQKAAYAANPATMQKAVSIAVYLAFEDAIIASKDASVTLDSVLGLGGLGFDLFAPVMADFMANANNCTETQLDAAATLVAYGSNGALEANQVLSLVALSDDEFKIYLKEVVGNSPDLWANFGHESIDEVLACDNHLGMFSDVCEMVNGLDDARSSAKMLCMLLALPTNLSTSLQETDPAISGLLALFAGCVIGNGLGGHPSAAGHNTLFLAVKDAYDSKYTAKDETISNLKDAYAKAYKKADEEGKIDELISYIDAAIAGLDVVYDVVDSYENEIPAEMWDIWKTLIVEISNVREDLEYIKDRLENDDFETAEGVWDTILELQSNLEVHKANIIELATELGILGELALNELDTVVDYYSAVIKEIADEAYAWLANGVKEFNAEYAAWVEEMGNLADKVDPALGAAVRKFLTEAPADALSILYAYGDEAAAKLFVDAAAAAGDIYTVMSALVNALINDAADIAEAIKNNAEVQDLLAKLEAKALELEATIAEATTKPVSTALSYEEKINALRAEITALYGDLYEAVMAAMGEVNPALPGMVDEAVETVLVALGIAADYGSAYGSWLADHADAMAGAVLNSLLANIDELADVACPIIDAIIWKTLADLDTFVGGIIDEVTAELNKQLDELNKALAELRAELDKVSAEVRAEIEAQIKVLEAKIETLKALLDKGLEDLSDVIDALVELKGGIEELLAAAADKALEAAVGAIKDVMNALEDLDKALNNMLGEAYEDLKDMIPVLTDKLVNAMVEAAKKYAPEVADAIYNYLYNNPEEVIEFVKTYGPYVLTLAEEYGDEALMVIGYILYEYGDEIAEFVIENHETILASMVAWVEVHGENTAKLLQVYAEALGLCDIVRDQIAALEGALEELEDAVNNKITEMEKEIENLQKELENAADELKATIEAKIAALEAELAALKAMAEAKIAEVVSAIESLKKALEEAINKGLTDLEAVKDAIENLDDKIAELIDASKDLAIGEINKAINAIEEAVAKLDDALLELAGEVYEELKECLANLVNTLIDEIIDAVKEYAPEVADAIYNYLLSNPEEVIEFFKTYGPYLMDLLEEYGDEALAVIGYALYLYGEDLAIFLVENADEIMESLLAWIEVHGENTAKLLQIYAEALGLCDVVREKLECMQGAAEEVLAALKAELKALEEELAALQAKLEELLNQLGTATEEVKAQIKDAIAKIETAIEMIEAKIEEIENAIADVIAQIEAIAEEIAAIAEALINLKEALQEMIETTIGKIKGNIADAVEKVQTALDILADVLETAENVINTINKAIDVIQAIAEEIIEKYPEVKVAVEETLTNLAQALIELKEALIELNAKTEEIIAALKEAYIAATTGEYTVSKDSYYVSLGDSTVTGMNTGDPAYGNYGYQTKVPSSFPYKLAEALGLDVETQYSQLALAGLRLPDLRYILDETFIPDEYTLTRTEGRVNNYAGGFEAMRETYLSELSKADLITLSIGNCNFTDFMTAQQSGALAKLLNSELGAWLANPYFGEALKTALGEYVDLEATTYEMDWEGYIGEEDVVYLNKALDKIKTKLIEEGIPENYVLDLGVMLEMPISAGELVVNIPVADLVTFIIESYLYGYVTFALNYAEVLNLIHVLAPEAEVVIVGMYHPQDDLILTFGDWSLPLGDYTGYFINALNAHYLTYAMVTPNTTYVDVFDAESFTDVRLEEEGKEFDLLDFMVSFGANSADWHATVDGHEYIKDQILGALTIHYDLLRGDVNLDGVVDSSDVNLLFNYVMGYETLSEKQIVIGDVTEDGVTDSTDVTLLLNYVMGYESL